MNVNLLKSKMAFYGDNQVKLAEVLNINKNSMCKKLLGKNELKRSEIEIIAKRYELTSDEIKEIFFS